MIIQLSIFPSPTLFLLPGNLFPPSLPPSSLCSYLYHCYRVPAARLGYKQRLAPIFLHQDPRYSHHHLRRGGQTPHSIHSYRLRSTWQQNPHQTPRSIVKTTPRPPMPYALSSTIYGSFQLDSSIAVRLHPPQQDQVPLIGPLPRRLKAWCLW